MMAIAPNRAATAEDAIDSPGAADDETLNPDAKPARGIGFDQQVHMVDLDAELQNAERRALRIRERGPQCTEDPITAQ
jgi:hypothetical protein